MHNNIAIKVENLHKSFGNGDNFIEVIKNASFTINKGELVALIAPSGGGKTTLLMISEGLLKPKRGRVLLDGEPLEKQLPEARRKIGLVFQDPDDQLFCPSVIEDVAFGPLNQGKTHGQARAIAEETLDALGILHLKDRVPYHLSGGEKRIAALATILSMRPELLLLDEPTAGLAPKAVSRLLEILRAYPARAIVVISHDSSFIEGIDGIRLILDKGRLSQAC